MKQIVDKLNEIAKAIDENVDIPNTDLITDSLDAITTALGGTPNDSNLIVDKLEDIAGVATGGGGGGSQLHYATITFVCNLQYGYSIPYYFVENNEVVWRYTDVNGGGGTASLPVLLGINYDEELGYVLDLYPFSQQFGETPPDIDITNTVNCEVGDGLIIITDPDSPASATITVSPEGGGK